MKEVGEGNGRIFPPQWDFLFPVWESNPAHMLQCMMMTVQNYQNHFPHRELIGDRMGALYDRNIDVYLRRQLWLDYDYNPYADLVMHRIFNPIGMESVLSKLPCTTKTPSTSNKLQHRKH